MATKMYFQCSHSGLLFPGDYQKQWGKKYGVGLGPVCVSEVLDSEYEVNPPAITNETRSIDQIMHPLVHCRAGVHMVELEESEATGRMAILHKDDPWMEKRAALVRAKQLRNPDGKLRLAQAAWERA